MTRLAILADDLTGAADAGGAFARAGLATAIVFAGAPPADLDILARSTDSRGLDAVGAAEANRRAARELLHAAVVRPPRWVYKKIDSALRGYPGEELVAIMAELGERRALVAPALPAEGRTTVGSRQRVDGVALDDNEGAPAGSASDLLACFGCEERVPVHVIDLATVRGGAGHVASVISAQESGILIADAETDRDLAAIARGALDGGIRVLAGSAGLARQLAGVLPLSAAARVPTLPSSGAAAVLVVAASRHDATASQVAVLEDAGIVVVRPSQGLLDGTDASLGGVVSDLAAHLSEGRPVVLTTVGLTASTQGGAFVGDRIADIVAELAKQRLIGGLVLTGGDVAAGVLSRLGASQITLGGEVLPAIPWGLLRSRDLPETPVVTKAGSFGDRSALLDCLRHLEG